MYMHNCKEQLSETNVENTMGITVSYDATSLDSAAFFKEKESNTMHQVLIVQNSSHY